jgi:DNA-binding HxlR family transcriptional regulator
MANTETIEERRGKGKGTEIPVSEDKCEFEDYDILLLTSETEKIRKLITKRGTPEIIMSLCCSTNPVRYKAFRQAMKGFSTRTLSNRLNELERIA